ncbi:MAG: ceramidase domain-containing protein [Gemmatimonadaceae bacterium]
MPDACFCEAVRATVPLQPANTVSSLGFVVVGLVVLAGMRRRTRQPALSSSNMMTSRAEFPLVFAAALVVVGLGSAWYHATLTFAAQFADVMGMYLVGVFILLYGWARLRPMRASKLIAAYLGLNALLAVVLYNVPGARRYVFAVLILIGLCIELASRRGAQSKTSNTVHLVRAVGALAVGFAVWTLDITGVLCSPDSLFQGHAGWHVLGAVASYEIYRYYAPHGAQAVVP